MVNQKALDYLKKYQGKYSLDKLRQKLVDAGYSLVDIEEASSALNSTTDSNNQTLPKKNDNSSKISPQPMQPLTSPKVKKSKFGLWFLIILLVLAIAFGVVAYFMGYINLPF